MNVKFQIGRSKCQVRVGGEGTLDRHHPIRHWFLFFHFQSFLKPVSFFVEPKWNTTLIFLLPIKIGKWDVQRWSILSLCQMHILKTWKNRLNHFFAKNCINIKSSIQDPHREIRMFCIIKWSWILFVKAETRWFGAMGWVSLYF